MDETFIDFLNEANSVFRLDQSLSVERCSPIDLAACLYFLDDFGLGDPTTRKAEITNEAEVYLCLTALNLLNHYCKISHHSDLDYKAFKPRLNLLLSFLAKKQFPLISFQVDRENDYPSCAIEVGPVQFAFHGIEEDDCYKALMKTNRGVVFDGIKKQPIASTVFSSGMQALKRYGNCQINGIHPIAFVDKQLQPFREGKVVICPIGLATVLPPK